MALQNTSNPLSYQRSINGFVYGYSDITLQVGAGNTVDIFEEVQDINYNWTIERQELGGTSPVPLGYTGGHVTFKGNFTISMEADDILAQELIAGAGGSAGSGRIPFTITLNYGPLPGTNRIGQNRFIRDVLFGCIINDGDNSFSRGNALTVKHNIVFLNMSRNGQSVI